MKKHFRAGWRHFWRQLAKVLRNPIFLVLTIVGNFALVSCAGLFFLFEHGINPQVTHFADAVWWAFATITTVGYGDTVPVTIGGRCVAVVLMLSGGTLFLSFIALLSSAFIELEFLDLARDVRQLRETVHRLTDDVSKLSSSLGAAHKDVDAPSE